MTHQTCTLSHADFDPLPEQPLRTARFWWGHALSLPLWLAVAVAYALVRRD